MLKREELTAEHIEQIVAGRPQGRLRLLPLRRGARGEPQRGAGALSARRRGVGVRLRLADVESGARIRRGLALQGRGLAPLLLLLDAARPRHARAARPDAGAGARRRVRGHRLSPGAGPGAAASWPSCGTARCWRASTSRAGCRPGCATGAPSPPSLSWSTPAHCQYCGDLPIERAAHHIAFAEGRRGACRDYLANTAAHARALGIIDPYIEDLVQRVGPAGRGRDAARWPRTRKRRRLRRSLRLGRARFTKSRLERCASLQSL